MALHVKKGDTVQIIAGEHKGATGRVLRVLSSENKVIVQGHNMAKKYVRPSQKNPQGGRVAKEAPMHVSNVMLYCGKCSGPVRVRHKISEKTDARGKRRRAVERICKKCGESLG
jgi:large subunit ribosomal protein L24